ncbi:hypothetical protein [Prescottella agglutinans]|uniref:4Fe-4S Wbl-type domain-containing protein n=1 Tax=Prescottella agglutinans TaxID=1644129 RepID=A0ABT6MEX3_9NOCA|nr:hypothetical protein [Prescottella agglutinans]MDH6282874.1 hypothetical protein [Prescottella agglutinans]
MSDPLEHAVCRSPEHDAAARKRHGHLWDYIIEGETDRQRHRRHIEAMQLCFTCPVIDACRDKRSSIVARRGEAAADGIWFGQLHLPPHVTQAGVGRPRAS